MRIRPRIVPIAVALSLAACSGDDTGGLAETDPTPSDDSAAGDRDGPASGDGATSANMGSGDAGTPGTPGTVPEDWVIPEELQLCDGPCACADGIDNDGDGVADGFDSECTGPNDDDEGTFATGIPGDNRDPKWQDCFFDGDSGSGNDGCRYSTQCLTGELADDDPDCVVTQECIDFCRPRTPNGCDCFGCCTFTLADGSELSVVLEAACDEDDLAECTACVPTTGDCNNECGRCELCLGKTIDDLPADCVGEPPGSGGAGGSGEPPSNYFCDQGREICMATSDCGNLQYCQLGCCVPVLD